jgi:hypothetical protein
MAATQHDADRDKQAKLMQERLERMGVQVRIDHHTGDSSFPTEYTLHYSFVQAVGPTLDLVLLAFTEKLLTYIPVEEA